MAEGEKAAHARALGVEDSTSTANGGGGPDLLLGIEFRLGE